MMRFMLASIRVSIKSGIMLKLLLPSIFTEGVRRSETGHSYKDIREIIQCRVVRTPFMISGAT